MKYSIILFSSFALLSACTQSTTQTVTTPEAVEMGDSTKAAMAKASYTALIAGDVDRFAANMADNAVFYWNAGDSIAGKAAIVEYWKDRRANVIDTLMIREDIWLPIQVNKLENSSAGDYVLMWAVLTSKYQFGGTTMVQRFHQVYRFNNEGKIDFITHYIDRYDVAKSMVPGKK